MSDEPQHDNEAPKAEDRNGATIVILAAVLLALGAFFVRRAM